MTEADRARALRLLVEIRRELEPGQGIARVWDCDARKSKCVLVEGKPLGVILGLLLRRLCQLVGLPSEVGEVLADDGRRDHPPLVGLCRELAVIDTGNPNLDMAATIANTIRARGKKEPTP